MNTGLIPIITHMLCNWGRWAVRQDDGGKGYSRSSPMFNYMPKGDAYNSQCPEIDIDANDTNEAIKRLSTTDRALCIEIYKNGGSDREIARRMGIEQSAFSRKIKRIDLPRIHRELMGHLNDISAGL